ncbi:MAG: alanine--tRNA ligase [Candidatus Cloacimonetes bacterium]|nr:alanine--tRNA ligase [Candidatus Cloacimonadota bacterium]
MKTLLRWTVSSSKEIRQQFIDFFKEKGHSFVHSSPVVPIDDPTLLFANAGMNQFKNIFLGQKAPDVPRAVNSQKCIRAGGKHNDLEVVGKDGYHHTFFEMLGNWSFGDYYKKEAILWAWELLTEVWKLDKSLLYATVHDSDAEACQIWQETTDIIPAHISFHGDKDNFWEMGDTGPCGPCSEIHIDRGLAQCNMQEVPGHICAVNGDCDRYIELWNLVFIQYKREADQSLTPLANRYVDTGAGLERIVQVLQNKDTNYETDLFMPIIAKIAEFSGKAYTPESGMSHRVIADHIRCLCFALADGGFPSNEGRGYVLRRILRRAARHGRLLGFAEPFLFNLVDTVVQIMGHHFEELKGKEAYIKMVIKAEEERFNKTLDYGLAKFAELRATVGGKLISGTDAFMLYDTYGFPLDLTMILAEEQGLAIDHEGFDLEMQAQRERARKASKFGAQSTQEDWIELRELSPSQFVGYETGSVRSHIQRYSINEDQVVALQLQKTPFYAESGGQVADTGRIYNDDFELKVHDVRKIDDAIIHYGTIFRGVVSGAEITAEIDNPRRWDIARNHTATHLLHQSLRDALGDHVQQKGSLVHPDYLRFDFTHFKALSRAELESVESKVNQAILANMTVKIAIQDIATAKAEGATALFGEKYADEVRVISIDDFSRELCGGTHVSATGQIGLFKIISEGSVAAGIRRIEALTGNGALNYVRDLQNSWARVAELLASPKHLVEKKLEAQAQSIHDLQAQVMALQAQNSLSQIDNMLDCATDFIGFKLIVEELPEGSDLKAFSDGLKDKLRDQIAVILCKKADKLSLLTVVGRELQGVYHAGNIVKAIAATLDGKGGGRADSAMGGGNNPGDLEPLIARIPEIIKGL